MTAESGYRKVTEKSLAVRPPLFENTEQPFFAGSLGGIIGFASPEDAHGSGAR